MVSSAGRAWLSLHLSVLIGNPQESVPSFSEEGFLRAATCWTIPLKAFSPSAFMWTRARWLARKVVFATDLGLPSGRWWFNAGVNVWGHGESKVLFQNVIKGLTFESFVGSVLLMSDAIGSPMPCPSADLDLRMLSKAGSPV